MTKKHFLFETERMYVRLLKLADLDQFHEMQSDPMVMKYVKLNILNFEENKADLKQLIERYAQKGNDFYIYAICYKKSDQLIGSVALVKDENGEDEIGYRFIPKYWAKGLGFEIAEGLINYCRLIKKKCLVAYVAEDNTASLKIIEKLGFLFVKQVKSELKIVEFKYHLPL